jgi:hypothetical protein
VVLSLTARQSPPLAAGQEAFNRPVARRRLGAGHATARRNRGPVLRGQPRGRPGQVVRVVAQLVSRRRVQPPGAYAA